MEQQRQTRSKIQILVDDLIDHLNSVKAQAVLNTTLQGDDETISGLMELCNKRELDITNANESRVSYMRILEKLDAVPSLDPEDKVRVVIPSKHTEAWRNMAHNLGEIELWGQSYPKFEVGNRTESSSGPDMFRIERFVDEYRHAPDVGKIEMLKKDNGDYAPWRVMAVFNRLGFEYLPTEELRTLGRQMDADANEAVINTNVVHYPLLASLIREVFEDNHIDIEEAYSALTTTTKLGRKGHTQTLTKIASVLPLVGDCNPRVLPAWSLTKKKVATGIFCLMHNRDTSTKTIKHMYEIQLLKDFAAAIPALNTALNNAIASYNQDKSESTYSDLFKVSNLIYNAMHLRNVMWNRNPTKLKDFQIGTTVLAGYANLIMENQSLVRAGGNSESKKKQEEQSDVDSEDENYESRPTSQLFQLPTQSAFGTPYQTTPSSRGRGRGGSSSQRGSSIRKIKRSIAGITEKHLEVSLQVGGSAKRSSQAE
jgi:hypothetical protein